MTTFTFFSYFGVLATILITAAGAYLVLTKIRLISFINMVEPLLSGIVLGLVPVTIAGLFTTAYLQFLRGDPITDSIFPN